MSTVAENSRKRSRAAAACEFCRKRKLKCDNGTPRCQHCESRNKDCVYAGQDKKPRPSNARIALLEEENERLRRSLSDREFQVQPGNEALSASSTSKTLHRNTRSGRLAENCTRPETPCSSQTSSRPLDNLLFLPDKEPRYHGPTSALFDEAAMQSEQPQQVAAVQDENQIKIQNQLLAETARQRQLEAINFTAGKLDFDIEDPELGMHLLSIYWNRQVHFGLIVYQTVFMRDMACAGPYFSKLLLNAIYFSASKNTTRTEVRRDPGNIRTAGYKYRQRFMELLSTEFDKSKITTVQALIIVAGALFTWCDERSTSFLYAGMSFNMIVDLGLHVWTSSRKVKGLSEQDLEVRRRLFWGAYVFDKIHAIYQGRPASLRTIETDVPMKFLDDYEELEQFRPLSYTDGASSIASPTHTISAFKEICKLSIILDRVLSSFYAQQSPKRNPADLLLELKSLYAELEDWRKALPRHLEYNSVASINRILLPHMISHTSMFNAIVILLHRPFVSEGHLHATTPSVAYDSFKICAAAASEINFLLQTYRKEFLLSQAPYMISYATYVSATIHVRIAAQREHGSEAYAALQTCLDVLDEQAKFLLAPRKAKLIVHRLMQRMGVAVGSTEVTLPSQPPSRTAMRSSSFGAFDQSGVPAADDLLPDADNGNLQANSSYPTERDDVAESQVLDFDIDAILRSFPHEPQISATSNTGYTQSVQYSQPTSNPLVTTTDTRADQYSIPQTSIMQNFDGLDATQTWALNNTPVFSDPIFGLGDFWFDFSVDQD